MQAFNVSISIKTYELSGFYEIRIMITVFLTTLHDIRTVLIETQKALYDMTKIGKWSINNTCDIKMGPDYAVKSNIRLIRTNRSECAK